METTKTIVQVIQELLALVTARNEKLGRGGEAHQNVASDPTVKKLLDELSLHGDDVSAVVDRSADYLNDEKHDQSLFEKAVDKLRAEAGDIPESLEKIFAELKR